MTHLQAGQIVSNMEKKSQEKKVSKDKKKSKVLNPKNGKMNQGTQGLLFDGNPWVIITIGCVRALPRGNVNTTC